MAIVSNESVDRTFYAAETRRRMAQVAIRLQAVLWAGQGDLHTVLCRVEEQLEASRLAGFEHIVQVCREMADCLLEDGLVEDRRPGPRHLAAVATTSLEACRAIASHAEVIAECALDADMPEGKMLRVDSRHETSTLLACRSEER